MLGWVSGWIFLAVKRMSWCKQAWSVLGRHSNISVHPFWMGALTWAAEVVKSLGRPRRRGICGGNPSSDSDTTIRTLAWDRRLLGNERVGNGSGRGVRAKLLSSSTRLSLDGLPMRYSRNLSHNVVVF